MENSTSSIAIWAIATVAVLAMLTRPRGLPEWVAMTIGAIALVVFRLVPLPSATAAIARGVDVYLFLGGMLVLAELASATGLFAWIAVHAVRAARGSPQRLFGFVFAAGIVVTALLSNDATAVVLTPAVLAAARAAHVEPLPFAYACAFIANSASFLFPFSNPANLIVFGEKLPALSAWVMLFGMPALVAIAATYGSLAWFVRRDLIANVAPETDMGRGISRAAKISAFGIGGTALVLVITSLRNSALGIWTAAGAVVVLLMVAATDRNAAADALRKTSWGVIPLVAGLFVLAAGIDRTGLLRGVESLLRVASVAGPLGIFGVGVGTMVGSNIITNLPIGLIGGLALHGSGATPALSAALTIGVDLGSNLTPTGSLSTLLWLVILRRNGIAPTTRAFLRAGCAVTIPAIVLSLAVLVVERLGVPILK